MQLLGFTLDVEDGGFPSFITDWMINGSARQFLKVNANANILLLVSKHVLRITLHELLRKVSPGQAQGIAAGLSYLHSKDVVHADLKAVCAVFDHCEYREPEDNAGQCPCRSDWDSLGG